MSEETLAGNAIADNNETEEEKRRSDVLAAFSRSTQQSIEQALAGLTTASSTSHNPHEERLEHLFLLQRRLHRAIASQIRATQSVLRDERIASSPLLSQSPEIWSRIAQHLDEVSLFHLERVTRPVYATCAATQRPRWDPQWLYLDRIRHSRSAIQSNNPRLRGIRFAKASLVAQEWEQRLEKANHFGSSSAPASRTRRHHYLEEEEEDFSRVLPLQLSYSPQEAGSFVYHRDHFVEDFGYFFQDPTQAGDPSVEFFLRFSYDTGNTTTKKVLLEGFQSNFVSLRHTRDAQDTGYHTYVGAGDRLQVVMVRNDLRSLRKHMGLDERYSGLDSDDSLELDSDEEEEELHFLQWPEASRKRFLDRLTVTVLRCDCGTAGEEHSGNRNNHARSRSRHPQQPRIVGSTRGYLESDQHFAIFRPLQILPAASSNTTTTAVGDHHDGERNSLVQIGLGCGGGESLHIVIKWVQQQDWD